MAILCHTARIFEIMIDVSCKFGIKPCECLLIVMKPAQILTIRIKTSYDLKPLKINNCLNAQNKNANKILRTKNNRI